MLILLVLYRLTHSVLLVCCYLFGYLNRLNNFIVVLGLPAVTASIHLVSPPCYRNSSGILSESDEPIAESLCCTASAMVWWLSRLQLTSNQLHPIPWGPKPYTERSSATQTCTATPSFLLRSACGTLCQLTYASCHLPGSKLSVQLMYMTAVLVFILCTALLLSVVICFYLPAPIHLAHLVPLSLCDITQLSWHLIWKKKKKKES